MRVLRRILGLTVVTVNEILIKDINPLFVFCIPELSSHFQEKGIVDKECEPLYSPTEIDKEIEAVEQYFDKIVTWRFRAKKQLGKNNKFKSDSDSCKTTEESKLIEPMKGLLGSALATVEGFAITAENYAKAVEILKDRFGRKDAIINSHMQKLLSVTPLKRSDDT
ncbi:uncharacterized protein TNCV_3612911 [Trichonephila clavipes]|uniref:Uncharacterized protein n=1 Tax=Trichonephila clavipes TaxID=2585209 RepID=A0A8X6SHV1_TRICX|nr:uncharacterized protein TNCV_3612911 [Trichonephila clavipes]